MYLTRKHMVGIIIPILFMGSLVSAGEIAVEYKRTVIDVRPSSIIRPLQEKNNPLEGLKKGDVIVGVDYVPRKITAIYRKDGEIVVETEQPSFSEAITELSIPDLDINLDPSTIVCEKGVTVDPSSMRSGENLIAVDFSYSAGRKPDSDVRASETFNFNEEVSKYLDIKGSVTLDYKLNLSGDVSFSNRFAKAKMVGYVKPILDLELNAHYNKGDRIVIPLYTIGTDLKLVNASLKVALVSDVDGKLEISTFLSQEIKTTIDKGYQVDYDLTLSGWEKDESETYSLGSGVSTGSYKMEDSLVFKASATMKNGVQVTSDVEALSFSFFYMRIWGGLTSEMQGVLNTSSPLTYLSGEFTRPEWEFNGELNFGYGVDCYISVLNGCDWWDSSSKFKRVLADMEWHKYFLTFSTKRYKELEEAVINAKTSAEKITAKTDLDEYLGI